MGYLVAVPTEIGAEALIGNAGLTECTTVNVPSEPLDAVPLLIHASEVVCP